MTLFALAFFAQDRYNLVVFSEDGRTFDLFVNSVKQNEEPAANIRVTDLNSPNAIVTVKFEDGASPDIQQNFYFQTPNTEVTARIRDTKKGYKLRYFGEVALAEAPSETDHDFSYTTTERVVPVEEVVSTTVIDTPEETVETTTTVTTTTETIDMNTGMNADGERIDVNISLGGIGIDMDVNIDDMEGMGTETESTISTTTTTTTTTTSSTSSSSNTSWTDSDEPEVVYVDRVILPDPPCNSDIRPIKEAMSAESFEDDRLAVSKRALKGKCLTVDQIKELAGLFTFEDNRLEFVMHAYDFCGNTDDYYQLNSVFTYSSDKEELNDFLDGK